MNQFYGRLLMILILTVTPSCEKEQSDIIEEPRIITEVIAYRYDSVEMQGYLAYDESIEGKRPGVIIVHDWFGHNGYVRERAEQLARLGYTAFAVDMFGNGKHADHPDEATVMSLEVMTDMTIARERFNAALKVLISSPTVEPSKIAAIGYCFGGSLALTMANSGSDLDAVAAFHSLVELPIMPNSDLIANVLVCNGEDDPYISKESVDIFKFKMDSIQASYRYIEYTGARHGFTNKMSDSLGQKFNLPLAYNKEADEKSWEELKTLLSNAFNTRYPVNPL